MESGKKEEEEKEGLSLGENIYYGVIWAAVFAVMIWYITGIAAQFKSSASSPSTVITFDAEPVMDLPKVTICNWNQIIAPYAPICDFCDLELIQCWDIASSSDCQLNKLQIAAVNESDGIFNCYQFNGDPNNKRASVYIGYYGSFSALFQVKNPPEDDTLRIGLQVSLTTVDVDPDVFSEDKFAPPGLDSYFAIQSIHTIYENETQIHGVYPNDLRYDASFSTTALTRKGNETYSYISVSWAFMTLNVEQISYIPQYTLNNFFGDFAGMIGTLMGLDIIKVASGINVAIAAYKARNIFPLQEHFNG